MAFPIDAFQRLASIEPGHFWFESRNDLIVWAIRTYFPDAARMLEVGCGTGFVVHGVHRALPHLHITASDGLPDGIAIARQRVPSADLSVEDARAIDHVARFDLVCAFDVIEHIIEDGEVLSRLHRAATDRGGLLITVPQHHWLWSRADELAGHVRRYSRRDLTGRLEAAGFEVVRMTSFVTLPLPLVAARRFRGSWRRAGTHCEEELRPPAAVNALLKAVLSLERTAIRFGVSWPVGSSLLAIARKR